MSHLSLRICGISFFIFLLAIQHSATAQTDRLSYGISSTVYAAEGETLPFWLYANRDGIVDPGSSNFINRLYSYYTRRDKEHSFELTAGFDAYGRFSADNALTFTQLFGKVAYRGFTLTAGRFYDSMGLNDHDLTMGSMLVSRNAIPIPKVRLATDGFLTVPATDGHLQFSAMIAHGWFTDERYIDNPFLHQKYLYIRYKHDRFDITAGAAHNAVWGGEHPGIGDQPPYELPSSFSDYMNVVLGQSASGNRAPQNEITNVVGNSIAAYEAKVGINFDHFRFKAYRLFYLEDKVALRFRSPWDGMWGAGIEFDDPDGFVTEILWEHLNTKRQNAWIDDPYGRTNYYNNGVYRSGWIYEGNVLGNPLIINGPVGNFDGGDYPISNNIVIAHHVGIKGKPMDRLAYKAFFTYSRNYGTSVDQGEGPPYIPLDELRVDEFYSFLQLQYHIAPDYGLSLKGSLAYDISNLYSDNRLGVQIGIQWERITN